MNKAPNPQSQSALTSFLVNIIIPVLILSYTSEGNLDITIRPANRDLWDLGPLWAMFLALVLPFGYGVYALIKQKKIELMSAVGLLSVILTGTVSCYVVVSNGGGIENSTPWLFGLKEALIPLSLALAVLLSHNTQTPLLRTFIYTPEIFNIQRIEGAIVHNNEQDNYKDLLWYSTLILTASLFLSSVGNFFLSLHYLDPILQKPHALQHIEYNQAVGKITWWGFLIIGVPMMIALLCIIARLVCRLKELTGLPQDDIMRH